MAHCLQHMKTEMLVKISNATVKVTKLNRSCRKTDKQMTSLFVIFRIVWRNDLCQLELCRGINTQSVVDCVVSLVLRNHQCKETDTRLHHRLAQVVRTVDTHTVKVRRRII